jgi:hypothetical protein
LVPTYGLFCCPRFQEMQRQYASGNYAKYGELLQQLEKLLTSP